jgi:hypothetical protein
MDTERLHVRRFVTWSLPAAAEERGTILLEFIRGAYSVGAEEIEWLLEPRIHRMVPRGVLPTWQRVGDVEGQWHNPLARGRDQLATHRRIFR